MNKIVEIYKTKEINENNNIDKLDKIKNSVVVIINEISNTINISQNNNLYLISEKHKHKNIKKSIIQKYKYKNINKSQINSKCFISGKT